MPLFSRAHLPHIKKLPKNNRPAFSVKESRAQKQKGAKIK